MQSFTRKSICYEFLLTYHLKCWSMIMSMLVYKDAMVSCRGRQMYARVWKRLMRLREHTG